MNRQIDRTEFGARAAGFALGLVLVAFPRASILVTVGLFVAALAGAALRRQAFDVPAPALGAAGLGILATVSAIWSPIPLASLEKGAFLLFLALAAGASVGVIMREPSRQVQNLLVGLAAGLTFAAALLAIELVTDEAIYRWVLTHVPLLRGDLAKHVTVRGNVVVSVSETEINRRTTVLTALWVPAMLLVWRLMPAGLLRGLLFACGAAGLVAIVITASHQSSQLAVACGGLAFLLSRIAGRWAVRAVAAAWIAVCLLIVPAVTSAYDANLHKAGWLFSSAKHRVVIWAYMAQKVGEAPIVGRAAAATPYYHEQVERAQLQQFQRDAGVGVSLVPHAHNVFLQAWYELGALGALVLMAGGLLFLRAIAGLGPRAQPFALAQFAATAALLSSSYGMWQFWLQALLALGAVGLALAASHTKSTDEQLQ